MFDTKKRRTAEQHGMSRDPTYQAWAQMIQRCLNPKNRAYSRYGGRGIKVCARWRKSFTAFLKHAGRRPSSDHSLDRFPDPDGDYKPGNIRWAIPVQQGRNKKHVSQIVLAGDASEPRTKLIAVRVKDDERRWVEGEAKRLGTSVADVIRLALAMLLDVKKTAGHKKGKKAR